MQLALRPFPRVRPTAGEARAPPCIRRTALHVTAQLGRNGPRVQRSNPPPANFKSAEFGPSDHQGRQGGDQEQLWGTAMMAFAHLPMRTSAIVAYRRKQALSKT